MPDWEALRAEFPGLARSTYLNTVSLGAISRASRDSVSSFLGLWEEHGASAWYEIWLGELAALRASFASLVGAREDEVAVMPNVSSALAALASALDFSERPRVVTSSLDFPTVAHAFRASPRCDVRAVASADGVRVTGDALAREIDERTACVATSQVLYTTGYLVDVREACRAARARGALSIVDAYQGAGQVPTDVREMGCDALVTGGLKWLIGGPGVAYLYVRRDLHERLTPTIAGWFGDADPFAFDASRWRPRNDARRFEMGTPAVAAVYAGRAGLDLVRGVGARAIRARTLDLARDLHERLADAGFDVASPSRDDERTGIVVVRHADAREVVRKLVANRIIVDARPGRVRVSPYFYNTLEENATFVDALSAAAK